MDTEGKLCISGSWNLMIFFKLDDWFDFQIGPIMY